MEIKKCKAVITGGASGLGEACIRSIVKGGGCAAILDLQDEKGNELSKEMGDSALYINTDVSSEKSVRTAIKKATDKFNGVNVAINCAGIGGSRKVLSKEGPMPLEFFKQKIQVNLVGTMSVLIEAAEQMAKNTPNEEGERGIIINTSSGAAFQGQKGQSAYSASKAGILGISLPIAREFGRIGIRIMAIAPGIFETAMFKRVPNDVQEKLATMVPFPKRMGRPDEFAKLALHIIENTYLNGDFIKLDGGLRLF